MIKLQDQVCSFELAKKIVALGVNYKGLYYWNICDDCTKEYGDESIELQDHASHRHYAALTVPELFQLLPHRVTTDINEPFNSFRLVIEKSLWINDMRTHNLGDFFIARYLCDTTGGAGKEAFLQRALFESNVGDEKLADCLAKMLIQLFDYGIIKLSKDVK
jgi:hypothetical protein